MLQQGYYNNPNATLEAFDDDGFFHTGDLFTSDANNNLRFVNRKSERIKRFTKDVWWMDVFHYHVNHSWNLFFRYALETLKRYA